MPQRRIELLSPEDKKSLKNRAIGTTFFALLIGAAGFCMIFFTDALEAMKWPSIAFLVFFESVTLFIIGGSIAGAVAKEKEVVTGKVTDKRTQSSHSYNSRSSSNRTDYYVTIDDEEISVMLQDFYACPKGAVVELHRVKSTKEIFKVVVLEHGASNLSTSDNLSTSEEERQSYGFAPRAMRAEETIEASMSEEERNAVGKALLSALLWRGALGGFLCWLIVYHLVLILLAFTVYELDFFKGNLVLRLGIPATMALGIWVWVNLKTWRLFLDWQGSEKTISVETVKDVVKSNSPKPGPNSTITGTGQAGEYAYADTTQSWLKIGPVLADRLSENSQVLVSRSLRAKLLLGVEEAI